jgi:hypothetical protein
MFYYHLPRSSHQIKLTCVYWMQNALCQALHASFRDPRAFQHYFAKQKIKTYLETASLRDTTSATKPYVQFSLHFVHNFCTKYFSNKLEFPAKYAHYSHTLLSQTSTIIFHISCPSLDEIRYGSWSKQHFVKPPPRIYCPIWANIGIRKLLAMLFSTLLRK